MEEEGVTKHTVPFHGHQSNLSEYRHIHNTNNIFKCCSLGTIHPRDGAERSGAKTVMCK